MVVTDSPKTKEALLQSNSWVDVRDVALGHVLALEKEAAGGERIINTAGTSLLGAIKFGTPLLTTTRFQVAIYGKSGVRLPINLCSLTKS